MGSPSVSGSGLETEEGETAAIALPEIATAYLHAADVEAKDW